VRVFAEGGAGDVRLSWRSPGGEIETIPPWALYVPPVRANGLLGCYYANGNWEGPPAFERIDPTLSIYFHVTPLPRPYTVEWLGAVDVPETGRYHFGLRSVDESMLILDGVEIVRSEIRDAYREVAVELEAGPHDIRVRFADRSHHTQIDLYWRRPGEEPRIVAAEALLAPRSGYRTID
jgi:beta-glucosidase